MDRMDVVGLVGLVLIGIGVWHLVGWAWCCILVGFVLAVLYAVREVRAIVRG